MQMETQLTYNGLLRAPRGHMDIMNCLAYIKKGIPKENQDYLHITCYGPTFWQEVIYVFAAKSCKCK